MSYYSQYILFRERIETFWTKDTCKFYVLSLVSLINLYVLIFFRYFLIYILRQNVLNKSDKKNFELYQVFMC